MESEAFALPNVLQPLRSSKVYTFTYVNSEQGRSTRNKNLKNYLDLYAPMVLNGNKSNHLQQEVGTLLVIVCTTIVGTTVGTTSTYCWFLVGTLLGTT